MLIPLAFGGWDTFFQNLPRFLLVELGVLSVVLLNLLVFLPRLYFQKKYVAYAFFGLFAVMVLSRALFFFAFKVLPESDGFASFQGGNPNFARGFNFTFPLLISLIGSALYEISLFGSRKEQEAATLRAEKMEAEMKFLKSQTNPHFLFNALNNIYAV